MGDQAQFPIQITGDASSLVAATQQTNTSLESTKIKLAELTPEQKAATAAMTGAGQAMQDTGKKAEAHSGHLREMHRLFHALNEVVPGLGAVMQAAFSPSGQRNFIHGDRLPALS